MSDLTVFNLFPLFPTEIRLLVWTYAFIPCVIPLEAEGYGKDEDSTALPFYIIAGRRPPDLNRIISRNMWSGRFVPSCIPSQAIFQVSQESRNHAFFTGYRIWKMQKRGGLVRNIIWHPAKDFILFLHKPVSEDRDRSKPKVIPFHWLRMFRVQFPMESSIMQNMAMYTSLWFRYKLEYQWVVGQLLQFKGMRRLAMVIDRRYEINMVEALRARNLHEESWGHWKLPNAINDTVKTIYYQKCKRRRKIAEVRLVEDIDGILTSPGVEATLRCYPCEYLGIV